MKLFYSINSPYARKSRIMIMEKGLEGKVEQTLADPLKNPPELVAINPLGKIPALVNADGLYICDSQVICEYLDSLTSPHLIPASGTRRFEVLALAALANGVMDLAVECVVQSRRPEEKRWPDWIARRHEQILRTIGVIAKSPLLAEKKLHFGQINVAVALAYVSFRLPHLHWRDAEPKLAQWLDSFSKRPSMLATQPAA